MIIFKSVNDLRSFLKKQRNNSMQVNFVPTMGALHLGHISLLLRSKAEKGITVSSIFINPTQFNDPADFEKYPQTIEKDIYQLEKANCDILFLPTVQEIYPDGFQKRSTYNLGNWGDILEGKFRPGHFQGVCQIVDRLLKIVEPDIMFLGQKDYQQCKVIKKLAELLNIETKIIICPTQREPDGLAMSSRNLRLAENDRKKASRIFEVLSFLKKETEPGDLKKLKSKGHDLLTDSGFAVEYLEFAHAETMEILDEWDGKMPLIILIAAFLGGIRLIDNLLINV